MFRFIVICLICTMLKYAEGQKSIKNERVVNAYKDSVDITWDPYPNATQYRVTLTNIFHLRRKLPPPVEVFPTTNKATIPVPRTLVTPFILIFVEKENSAKISEIIKTENLLFVTLTQAERPTVKNLQGNNVTLTTILLSWDHGDHVENATYQVTYSLNNQRKQVTTTTNKTALTMLRPGSTYNIEVEVIKDGNTMLLFPYKSSITITTFPLAIKTGQTLSRSMFLSWGEVANAIQYHVRYSEKTLDTTTTNSTTTKSNTNTKELNTTETSVILTNLKPNTTYTIMVKVLAVKSMTLSSPFQSAAITKSTTPVFELKIASNFNVTNTTFECSWNRFKMATLYRVSYKQSNETTYKWKHASTNSILIENLLHETEHKLFVEVNKINDETPIEVIKSDLITFTTADSSGNMLTTTTSNILMIFLMINILYYQIIAT